MIVLLWLACAAPPGEAGPPDAAPATRESEVWFTGAVPSNAPQPWFGELTGDGVPDLLAASDTSWLISGTTAGTPVSTPDAVARIVRRMGDPQPVQDVGDVDADGVDDLVVAGTGGVSVVWGPLSGVVDLQAVPIALPGCSGGQLVEADGDAARELLVSCGDEQVVVDAPTRDAPAGQPLFTVEGWLAAVGDFDGDGLTDFAWREDDAFDGYSVAFSPFDGTASAGRATLRIAGPSCNWRAVALADVNGDGADDLAVGCWGSAGSAYTAVLTGLGPGERDAAAPDARVDSQTWELRANWASFSADVDGDGAVDLVGVDVGWPNADPDDDFPQECDAGRLWVARGPLVGDVRPQAYDNGTECYTVLGALLAGDLDGDGDAEVALYDRPWIAPFFQGGVLSIWDE